MPSFFIFTNAGPVFGRPTAAVIDSAKAIDDLQLGT
jgi:hypothetical protein